MKQLLLTPGSGRVEVAEVPAPSVAPGTLLVRSRASLVSAGTERMILEFSEKSLAAKARSRPDLVKKVVDKARREGVLTAYDAVRARLDEPVSPGYSCAGTVLEVGEGLTGYAPGDRVAVGGAGHAVHAEVVRAPKNLVVPIPDGVRWDAAAFTTVGAIALHGFRLGETELGETVVVLGLGLVGLLTVQIAKAAGCAVLGLDLDPDRVELAERLGADVALCTAGEEGEEAGRGACVDLTGGIGADAVLITAATESDGPVRFAAELARDRGKVVSVGAVGLDLPRRSYFEKELDFVVSRSYGPGRYDPEYEEKGRDYPVGYVRWTENRNLRAFVELLARGKVDVGPLVTHRFDIEEGERAYGLLSGDGEDAGEAIGILLEYPERGGDRAAGAGAGAPAGIGIAGEPPAAATMEDGGDAPRRRDPGEPVGLGLLGAGQFARSTLLPALSGIDAARLVGVCTATGSSARHAADRFSFEYATTGEEELLGDERVEAVVVATRHHLHARQVEAALRRGKHVFCEKPLCLDEEELRGILRAWAATAAPSGSAEEARGGGKGASLLTVGFNRRFSPMARELRGVLEELGEPLVAHYRVNAGRLPPDHWVHDPEVGGGRIIGEGCHFVDLLAYLSGAVPVRVSARGTPDAGKYRSDNVTLTCDFADGSVGTVLYTAAGDPSMGKERLEVFAGGFSATLDDYRRLDGTGPRKVRMRHRLRQEKGHAEECERFVEAVRAEGALPIRMEELVATTLTTFAAVESLRTGEPVEVDAPGFIRDALADGEGAP